MSTHSGNRIEPVYLQDTELTIAWQKFVQYCFEMQHGRFEKLEIANGVPVSAETATQKVKFT